MGVKNIFGDSSETDINFAIDCLSKAAGIFQYLNASYASTWGVQDGPPETTTDSLLSLIELAIGDAHQLACLKAERKQLSIGSIRKLKAASVVKYIKCEKLILKHDQEYEDFSRAFKSHIHHVRLFLEADLLLSMAKAHVEKDEYGLAVAEITGAHNMFVECLDAENSQIKKLSKSLMEESGSLHGTYTKMNSNVIYQPVPSLESIRLEYQSNAKFIVDVKLFEIGRREKPFESADKEKANK